MIEKSRLDLYLLNKGLCETRQKAQGLILAGKVRDIYGKVLDKPGQQVLIGSELFIDSGPMFVSRGGEKLLEAFKRLEIFFKSLREICDKYNSLLILDEVQSGVGRTGKMWGYENLGIEPDGFSLAKGLGGGHAIGALLVKEKANIFSPGDHASTFGGNPFACKAAQTVLEEINRRNIINNVYLRGEQLSTGFEELSKKFPNIISGKRGLGLIQGLVINNDYADAKKITLKAFDKGLLVVPAGGNVVRIVPPLVISRREINILLHKLNSIFEDL